ncbi:MAG TPA: pyridoxal phosphate-dependent aminotransferase [Candidatus Avoscillospira avistercoris]|uniref:cysteine-S-conjugate beta-lyase n=1 Tax=Candidatus Avoscillospira avistercoris TaxID=2840707 RepID=A0A9D1FBH3_9FIRM|nr:pyridoxal phosphate-dependent aminotransferase [Candidatus Avoscillospira avistercoris]
MDFEKFCQENCVERKGTGTLKWDSLEEVFGDADLLPLWVADMEIQSPPAARQAIQARVEHGTFGYAKVTDDYYDAFFSWQKNHHGVTLAKENLRFATGVVGSLYAAVRAYTQPNDGVIICPPVYYPFYDAILNTGRTLVTCELDNHDGRFTLDLEKFEKTIAESKAKMFLLCSPHNPVCRVWTEEELEGMFAVCRKHGVLVVADEIHQDFTYDKDHAFFSTALLGDGQYKDMLILLNSGSKTFNLAGLIHSHVIIFDEKLMETYDAYIKSIGSPEVNLMGVIAMGAAFRDGAAWFDQVKALICHNYDYMKQAFAKDAPKIVLTPLEGTYLSWLDLRGYMDGKDVAEFIQKKCRLACDVGEWFSFTGHGYVRINLATDTKYIKMAVERILANLKELS